MSPTKYCAMALCSVFDLDPVATFCLFFLKIKDSDLGKCNMMYVIFYHHMIFSVIIRTPYNLDVPLIE